MQDLKKANLQKRLSTSYSQSFQGTGPAVARTQPDGEYKELQDRSAGTKKPNDDDFVEVPLITEDSPLILN